MQIFLSHTFVFAITALAAIDSYQHDLSVREALQLLRPRGIEENSRIPLRRNNALFNHQQLLAKRLETMNDNLLPRSPISRNDAGYPGRGGQGSGSPARQRPAQGRGSAQGSGTGSSEARIVSPERSRPGGPAGATGSGQLAQGHEAARPQQGRTQGSAIPQPAPGESMDQWAQRLAQSRPSARYQRIVTQGPLTQGAASQQAEHRPPTEQQNPGSGPAPPGSAAE